MTEKPIATKARWAVLIGLDLYNGEDGQLSKDRCLNGAVNDVKLFKSYLKASPLKTSIFTLTATTPPDQHSPSVPSEDEEQWPTHANVTELLLHISRIAKRGDHVLIHYSGHGTRKKSVGEDHGNLALVLFSPQKPHTQYFYGTQLASCLKKMVEKELIVTLVLDCCFSGSVLRSQRDKGEITRAIEYSPTVAAASPNDFLRSAEPDQTQWIVKPKGYTVLAACGPHEHAGEVRPPTATRDVGSQHPTMSTGDTQGLHYGALSHYLHKALAVVRGSGVVTSHESLYERLIVEFQVGRPQQTPMRYGDGCSTLFGTVLCSDELALPSLFRRDSRIFINSGKVHGASYGDRFSTFPFGSQEADRTTFGRNVRIIDVWDFTSEVEVEQGDLLADEQSIMTGWKAKPLDSLPQKPIVVCITHQCLLQIGGTILDQKRMFMKLIPGAGSDTEATFTLQTDGRGKYVILDGSSRELEGLPLFVAGESAAAECLMNTLQHLSTYEYFKRIKNEVLDAVFEETYTLSCAVENSPLTTAEVSHVKHLGYWQLKVENHSEKPLYLALFDFCPSWEILNVLGADQSGFRVVEKGAQTIKLRMGMSQELLDRDHKSGKDVIKVFITNRPTTFPLFDLGAVSIYRSPGTHGHVYERTKELSNFLRELMTPTLRSGKGDNEDRELARWMCQNYTIHTHVGDDW